MSTRRAKAVAADTGLFKVSVKIQTQPDPSSHTVWCATLQEWYNLRDAYDLHPALGFKGQYFSIPPGVPVVLLRLETLAAA